MKNTIKVNETININNVEKELEEFEKLLACINTSEKSLFRLEKELYNIIIKCALEFIHRNKLSLIARVFDRLESNELTKKAYSSKVTKAFNILTGGFVRDDKGSYFYSKSLSTTMYLKKEKIFLERIDLDDAFIKRRLIASKELIDSEFFSSLKDLYSLKNESVETNYSSNFLKALITIEKNQSKLKGKNKSSILELIEFARNLELLPKKEDVDLLPTGQANFQGKPIKKVA